MELINHCHFYYAQAEYDSLSKAEHVLSEKMIYAQGFFFHLIWKFTHLGIWNDFINLTLL